MRKREGAGRMQAPAGGVSPAVVKVFAEAIRVAIPVESEDVALRADLERELRGFVSTFDTHPEWLWSPATVRFVRAVRPKLELLGGPVGPADGGEPCDEGRQPGAA